MRFSSLCLAAACLFGAALAHAAELPPVEQFFDNPRFGGALLSPDGKALAVRVASKGTRERLAVLDIATNKAKVVAEFADVDVADVDWISDKRLVLTTRDKRWTPGGLRYGPGMYAVNSDGSNFLQLVSRTNNLSNDSGRALLPLFARKLAQPGKQDSDYVYMELPQYIGYPNVDYVDLMRLNTLTGKVEPVPRPEKAVRWLLDDAGEPRMNATLDKGIVTLFYRDPDGKWRSLTSFPLFSRESYTPIGFGPDGTLYARAFKGGDKEALYTVDLATGKLNERAIVALDGFDFTGQLITGKTGLLGVTYTTDSVGTHWLDAGMAAIQAKVDALLPDTVNQISLAKRAQTPVVLVTSFSDRKPQSFRLYNYQTGDINKVGEAFPTVNPAAMGSQAMVRYKARDGLEIPAKLTLPPGIPGKNLPMVVLVHGGPFLRGTQWGWNGQSQFLATRGYAVLEPDFRGSTGYGTKHNTAGFKQWGLAMQDDVTDGAKWAIEQGIADGKRICIAGASYGGYATLMGLIKEPELFKCGVAWAGVTDLNLLYEGHWSFESDMSDVYKQYGFRQFVGDPVTDAAKFAATSPLKQAARLKQPLLLAHGSADMRVPLYHGTQFRDAVKAGNDQVEWIEYEEEGHGWSLVKNRVDFWTRVEKFLERNIGKPPAP
jgi:dipeptidyl aminopeptidase/acylaminoacyl peptidase